MVFFVEPSYCVFHRLTCFPGESCASPIVLSVFYNRFPDLSTAGVLTARSDNRLDGARIDAIGSDPSNPGFEPDDNRRVGPGWGPWRKEAGKVPSGFGKLPFNRGSNLAGFGPRPTTRV